MPEPHIIQPSPPKVPAFSEKRILVGIASRLEEILMTGVLRQAGYIMHAVDTQAMAIAALQRQDFHALILDNRLIDYDAQTIASYAPNTPLLVLAMSASHTKAHNVITPPLTPSKICRSLRQHLKIGA